jgi:hypothetical protein
MLLVSAVMLSTATFAWFTMGETATASGMNIKATTSSTLLIAQAPTLPAFEAATGATIFTQAGPRALKPATHYVADTHGTVAGATSGLVTVNANNVDPSTGAYLPNNAYVAVPTVENNTSDYYVDYVVYLGASGYTAMSAKNLTVTLDMQSDLTYLLHNAVTIDFLVDESVVDTTSGAEYVTSVNLKTVDAATDNIYAHNVNLATNITIPQSLVVSNVTDEDDNVTGTTVAYGDCIQVIMRVYFDGALVETAATYEEDGETVKTPAKYYVRNAQAVANAIAFGVQFDAVDYTA